MSLPWFKRTGIFFIPVSIVGWVIMLAGIACAVFSFIDIDSKSHSVSDTMMNFVFNLVIIFAVYTLVAFIASRK